MYQILVYKALPLFSEMKEIKELRNCCIITITHREDLRNRRVFSIIEFCQIYNALPWFCEVQGMKETKIDMTKIVLK